MFLQGVSSQVVTHLKAFNNSGSFATAFRSITVPCRAERTLEGETFGSDSPQSQGESGPDWE